MSVVQYNLL